MRNLVKYFSYFKLVKVDRANNTEANISSKLPDDKRLTEEGEPEVEIISTSAIAQEDSTPNMMASKADQLDGGNL